MRLTWTAVVPRTLVEGPDAVALTRQRRALVLTVIPHPDPSLCIVRCYRRDPRVERPPAA
jgi:hypothetical protein